MSMRYQKQPLSFAQQADQLLSRGLTAERGILIRRLQSTSYFRLSGYLYYFRQTGSEQFQEGTSLEQVWDLCCFDQRLRTLLMDAIEAVEVYVRTQLSYHLANDTGDAFSYTDPANLPELSTEYYRKWLAKLKTQVRRSKRSKEEFVVHFFRKYGDSHSDLPIWSLIELMDFGTTFTFYRGSSDNTKKLLAAQLDIPDVVLTSWLQTLYSLRNRCAHHARLWNWQTGVKVKLPNPRKYPLWHQPMPSQNRLDVIFYILRNLLHKISPQSQWHVRVEQLFLEFPETPLHPMGLDAAWQQHALWNPSKTS